jgi:integrase
LGRLEATKMMKKRTRGRAAVELPRGVHRVVARGREYFYYQPARGTPSAGDRIRLPSNPHSPEFWTALRQAQGIVGAVATDTVDALIESYMAAWPTLPEKLAAGTQNLYRRNLKRARTLWGKLPATGLRPAHVQAVMMKLADTPGAANNFISTMRALSAWARLQPDSLIDRSLCEGVRPYKLDGGHRPWTEAQIKFVQDHFTGSLRRGVLLMLYTGQRGSDAVRLGPTMIDDGGFDLGWRGQVKTGARPWCPILPELAKEMESWEKRPGPFVLTEFGKPYTRKYFAERFKEAKEELAKSGITVLDGTSLHGLRATAVSRLKRAGLADTMISDIVGMSIEMIARYTRFENKRESGKAALVILAERAAKKNASGTL